MSQPRRTRGGSARRTAVCGRVRPAMHSAAAANVHQMREGLAVAMRRAAYQKSVRNRALVGCDIAVAEIRMKNGDSTRRIPVNVAVRGPYNRVARAAARRKVNAASIEPTQSIAPSLRAAAMIA